MPIEIREIIIKTEISNGERSQTGSLKEKELTLLKKQVMEECKRILVANTKKSGYKR
ncbi:MAG: hypothetical protein H7Y13_14050 [Sphingobacteriaceae bacterium]|nr:hypothetical protein [Sphingobacteriaceae bacterium]